MQCTQCAYLTYLLRAQCDSGILCLICFLLWLRLWTLHFHITACNLWFHPNLQLLELPCSFVVETLSRNFGCGQWACSSCLGALCSSLSCPFSSFHYLSFGLLLPPSRTIFDVLEPSFHQQLWADASMCSAWWAASGCWSFSPYPSPPFSLLFSSLYSASWPLLRFSGSPEIDRTIRLAWHYQTCSALSHEMLFLQFRYWF